MHGDARHPRAHSVGLCLGTDDLEGAWRKDGDDRTRVVRPGRGGVASEIRDDTLAGRDERVAAGVRHTGAQDGVAACQLCFTFESFGAQQLAAPRTDSGSVSANSTPGCFSLRITPRFSQCEQMFPRLIPDSILIDIILIFRMM